MIKCPYCGKEFEVQAIDASAGSVESKPKWYFSTYWLVIGILCIGPFALPLMWFNPRYKPITKIIVSIVVITVSIWLYMETKQLWDNAMRQWNQMGKF
ncbi:MAG: hypothetical protein ABSE89_11085 [Sedimentisphaerales bacterium]